MLDEIVAELQRTDQQPIQRARVQTWMAAADIDAMGAVYALLCEPDKTAKITPPIDAADVMAFFRRYFERCIGENPESAWADSRYSAGGDLARWLRFWAKSGDLDLSDLEGWTQWLAGLYKGGDDAIRLAIETATLEHILDEPTVAKAFAGWLKDQELAAGYERSLHGPGAWPDVSR